MLDDTKPFLACFDAATSVGVCDGRVGGKARTWTWDLRKAGIGRAQRLLYLSNFVNGYFNTNKVDFAFIEAPLPISVMMEIGSSDETVQMLRGIVAIIEVCAARALVPVAWWNVQDARKAVTGVARFKRGEAKGSVLKYVRMLGYEPADDNQADALVGWLHESTKLNPRLAALNTPLFGRG